MQRSLGMILKRCWCAEDGHHGVTGELLDRTAGCIDFVGHGIVEALKEGPCPLRILRPAELCRTNQVSENHRHKLPFALVRLRIYRSRTRRTETSGLGKSGATVRASRHRPIV